MAFKSKLLLAFLLFIISMHETFAQDWPKLESKVKSEECDDAFQIAAAMYKSDKSSLLEPIVVLENVKSKLVLGSDRLTEENNAATYDSNVFSKEKRPPGYPFFWQIKPEAGLRIVIANLNFGWRDSGYAVLSIPDKLSISEYIEQFDTFSSSAGNTEAPYNAFITRMYELPVLFQKEDSSFWLINKNKNDGALADWEVSSLKSNKVEPICSIKFRAFDKDPTEILPREVQVFAKLLDGTLGDGRNDGTNHSTYVRRLAVADTWANIAQRPWAKLTPPDNSNRKFVDQQLLNWALPVKSFYKLYLEIQEQYPGAEKALEKYYATDFNMPLKEAKALAKINTDIAFRTYFHFNYQ